MGNQRNNRKCIPWLIKGCIHVYVTLVKCTNRKPLLKGLKKWRDDRLVAGLFLAYARNKLIGNDVEDFSRSSMDDDTGRHKCGSTGICRSGGRSAGPGKPGK